MEKPARELIDLGNPEHYGIQNDHYSVIMFRLQFSRLPEDSQYALYRFYKEREGLTYQEIVDELSRMIFQVHGGLKLPPGLLLSLRSYPEPGSRKLKVLEPVHGPFDTEVYNDPDFVEHYKDVRFESRVDDIVSMLRGFEGHVLAPGDGVGVVYRAVKILQDRGQKITVESSDISETMCGLAQRMGHFVECKPFVYRALKQNEMYFISHLTDYLTDRDICLLSSQRTIVYGRAVSFPFSYLFKMYRAVWGYQLCSSDYVIPPVHLLVLPKELPDIDYSVFGLLEGRLDIALDVDDELPEYREIADSMGMMNNVATSANEWRAWITSRDFSGARKTIVGVPHVGVIGPKSVVGFMMFMPLKFVDFASSFSYYHTVNPVYCTRAFFAPCVSVRVQHGCGQVDVPGKEMWNFKFFRIPKIMSNGVVTIRGCRCFGLPVHDHSCLIASKNLVEWKNFLADVRRMKMKLTRNNLFLHYCRRVGSEAAARFTHFERVASIVYDSKTHEIEDNRAEIPDLVN